VSSPGSSAPALPVLYEDGDLVAVSKPPGEPVIPARGEPEEACLHRRLQRQLGRRLWVVHRIDRDASGLVVFARSAAAHRAASLAFEHRQVEKTYLAFVAGTPEEEEGEIAVALHGARRGKTRPARPGEAGGQEARTRYRVLRRWPRGEGSVTLLETRPSTGRHHQIRVHLRSIGTPILFDPLYGRGFLPEGLGEAPCSRLALHAGRLALPRRDGSGAVLLEAPLAEDLARLREWLDRS
jgi:tRNA pseudouridine32 synthase/23S rRNA pseudouridine746 synthase